MIVKTLPEFYDDKRIVKRLPFTMPGDLVVAAATNGIQFPDSTFLNNTDYVLEITKALFFVTGLDSGGTPIADPTLGPNFTELLRWVTIQMKFVGVAFDINKAAQRLSSLVDKNTLAWEFDDPCYIKNSQGFSILANNALASGQAAGGIRLEVSFLGSALVLAA